MAVVPTHLQSGPDATKPAAVDGRPIWTTDSTILYIGQGGTNYAAAMVDATQTLSNKTINTADGNVLNVAGATLTGTNGSSGTILFDDGSGLALTDVLHPGDAMNFDSGAITSDSGGNLTVVSVSASSFIGDGTSITNVLHPGDGLDASDLTGGTVPSARIGGLGTPTSGTLTSCTGLPVSTGISGMGTGVATFLATPTSANLRAALTDETGTGAAVFATSPTFSGTAGVDFDVAPHNMTGASAPTPYVVADSSHFSGLDGWHIFDGGFASANCWANNGTGSTGWVSIDFGSGVTHLIKSYSVTSRNDVFATRAPKNWTLEGSNDGSTWTTIDTVTNQTSWSANETRSFTCDTVTTAYRYFRINISANNGDASFIEIGEMTLIEAANDAPVTLSGLREYSNNAAAVAAGLAAGKPYRQGDFICVVH